MASFLNLPYNIRLKIYQYSGLVRPCPIELNIPDGFDPHKERISWCLYRVRKNGSDRISGSKKLHPDCSCDRLPIQLLNVSRSLYEDSLSVLYSENKFILRVRNPSDLGLLQRLNSHAISRMHFLLVRLNCWPCVRGHDELAPGRPNCGNCGTPSTNSEYSFSVTSPAGQHLLAEWKKLSLQLTEAITPRQLRLTFICDVTDLDSGKAILEPLSSLPALSEYNIRLSQRPDYELGALTKTTSAQNTGSYIRSSAPFPFRRLPRELRLHVLGYTDLGRKSHYHKRDDLLRIEEGKLITVKRLDACHGSKCCRQCTEMLMDCCCSSIRAACSTTCICRRLPFELFYVSKEMRQDAVEVMLSRNCFEFLQDPEKTTEFLSRFPARSLEYVNQIKFHFSEEEVQMWAQWDYSRKWFALIAFIKGHFRLMKLSIVLVVETFDLGISLESQDERRFIYDVYCDITRTLRILGKVDNIRFDLGFFTQLSPLMSRAVDQGCDAGKYPELDIQVENRDHPVFRIPNWYKEADLTGGAHVRET